MSAAGAEGRGGANELSRALYKIAHPASHPLRLTMREVHPMWIYLSLLVAIIGCLMYALAANPKLVELGRLAFFAGLWVFLIKAGEGLVGLPH